ncbi:MAG TPA: EAL domain-containing protein [Usitatibacter sp.]|nr:EAL domain-containing protein [Usitatibacter sp.]
MSRTAEDLVRAGNGEAVRWQGLSLRSYLQPIYSVRKASCIGFEALVRASDENGPVRPEKLFERARLDGDIVLLDWICRALHLRKFATVDRGDRKLFLNAHPEAAIRDARSARELADLVRYYGMVPSRLTIEILEAPCPDETLLREAVAAYRALGAAIAMDDFGLGRSNFDRIVALRPDIVKIDRSILTRTVGEAKSRRMLPSIVELLHEAGAQVAIEGIENAHEALVAIESGADHLQGFHFAAPSANLPDELLADGIMAELLRMRGAPRLAVVGND